MNAFSRLATSLRVLCLFTLVETLIGIESVEAHEQPKVISKYFDIVEVMSMRVCTEETNKLYTQKFLVHNLTDKSLRFQLGHEGGLRRPLVVPPEVSSLGKFADGQLIIYPLPGSWIGAGQDFTISSGAKAEIEVLMLVDQRAHIAGAMQTEVFGYNDGKVITLLRIEQNFSTPKGRLVSCKKRKD
jgi:hypothetical protein